MIADNQIALSNNVNTIKEADEADNDDDKPTLVCIDTSLNFADTGQQVLTSCHASCNLQLQK